MKKIIPLLIITALTLSACTSPKTNNTDNIRTINGFISGIDSEYIYINTEDGNGWILDYEDGYTVDDNLIITFDTLGNDDIYDDEIISIETGEQNHD